VATFDGEGNLLAAKYQAVVQGADAWLTPAMRDVLQPLPRTDSLDRVAVTVGPGAFVGIRVGLAHAAGFAMARGLPLAPLSSLALRAALVPGHPAVLAALDAKKGRVYAACFDTRGPIPVPLGPEEDIDPLDLLHGLRLGEIAPLPIPAVGQALLAYPVMTEGGVLAAVADPGRSPVGAAGRLILAAELRDPVAVTPVYLREPDAVARG
jgi:tRNA threonylcarbamoyladenosine biosynthesis protein TsaB